jgi:hypothetical protein
VLDRPTRNCEAIALHDRTSDERRIAAQEPHLSQSQRQTARKQPRRLAVERWESEGGATCLKSPRAD